MLASVALASALASAHVAVTPGPETALRLAETISLPGVRGRIDHLAVDPATGRLFVAALGNGSVEVLDLGAGKWLSRLEGFEEPQGLGWHVTPPRLVVASGDGSVRFFDGVTLAKLAEHKLGSDADNVRVDDSRQLVFVGYGAGGIAGFDAPTGEKRFVLPLQGHPESFQLLQPSGLFVNVPTAGGVAFIDLRPRRVKGFWRLDEKANYPLAIDAARGRVLVATRQPAHMIELDAVTGKRLAAVAIGGDSDDLFLDARSGLVYAICGEGFIDVLERAVRGGKWRRRDRVATAPGARTGLLVTALNRLYVAVPQRGGEPAEMRGYALPEEGKP